MDWIDRIVSKGLSELDKETTLSNPWGRQSARLAILYGLEHSRRLSRTKLKEARYVFQKEFDEYVANSTLGPMRPAWDPNGEKSIPYHYSRILALTVAVEFSSGDSASALAKAIREEATGLSESYFRWCEHILGVWSGSIHRTES